MCILIRVGIISLTNSWFMKSLNIYTNFSINNTSSPHKLPISFTTRAFPKIPNFQWRRIMLYRELIIQSTNINAIQCQPARGDLPWLVLAASSSASGFQVNGLSCNWRRDRKNTHISASIDNTDGQSAAAVYLLIAQQVIPGNISARSSGQTISAKQLT